jgi:hypothetical protein
VLGRAVGCLGTVSLSVDLAPSFPPSPFDGLRANPCTMHLFPSLPIPFCSSHTSSSLRLRCTTIVFLLSFSFFTPSAYWICLSLFQGNPTHSFLQLTVSPFIATLISCTPFGTYSTRAHTRKSTIHSFCSSGQPEFYTTKNKNSNELETDLREDLLPSTPASNNPTTLHIDCFYVLFSPLPE